METNLNKSSIQHIMLPNTTELRGLGLPETGKINLLFKDHMRVIVRLENLADKFDLESSNSSQINYFDIENYAHLLYKLAN